MRFVLLTIASTKILSSVVVAGAIVDHAIMVSTVASRYDEMTSMCRG